MGSVAETGTTVLLSSHLLADLERVCDYLIVLHAARVNWSAAWRTCSPSIGSSSARARASTDFRS